MSKKAAASHMSSEVRRGVIFWCLRAAVGLVLYGLILFLAAGTVDWIWGWALLAVLAAFLAAHPLILVPRDPALLAERNKGTRAEGVKRWDKLITSLSGSLMFVTWIVAGLDVRLGWTGPLALGLHLAGLLGNILGYSLFLWAMASNSFFAEGVRIQEERGHIVATGGPYKAVRHPGYAGAILAQAATPLLLGSFWALIPALGIVVLYVTRTKLEDEMLQAELAGYRQYAQQTRFRLVPGLW